MTEASSGGGWAATSIDELGDGPGFRKIRGAIGVTAFGINAIVLPPGVETGRHFHDRQEEVYFVHRGRLRMEFGDGGEHRAGAREHRPRRPGDGPDAAQHAATRTPCTSSPAARAATSAATGACPRARPSATAAARRGVGGRERAPRFSRGGRRGARRGRGRGIAVLASSGTRRVAHRLAQRGDIRPRDPDRPRCAGRARAASRTSAAAARARPPTASCARSARGGRARTRARSPGCSPAAQTRHPPLPPPPPPPAARSARSSPAGSASDASGAAPSAPTAARSPTGARDALLRARAEPAAWRPEPTASGSASMTSAPRPAPGGRGHRTPVLTSGALDERCGGRVFLKAENFQRGGAFKFRGAYNAVPRSRRARRRGLVVGQPRPGRRDRGGARLEAMILMPTTRRL